MKNKKLLVFDINFSLEKDKSPEDIKKELEEDTGYKVVLIDSSKRNIAESYNGQQPAYFIK